MNTFSKPNGDPLADVCIFNDCRNSLKDIALSIVKGIKALSSGPDFFYEIERIDTDNVYWYDMGEV